VDVLDAVISGIRYPSGWLHDALRGGDKSLVYVVHAYPAFGIDGGYFGIMAQTTPDNYEKVLKIILDKMALIQNVELDPAILKQAKSMCIAGHEIGKYPDLIERVSAGDVLRVAKKLFAHHLIVATKPKQVN
jgi:zinc protease